MMGPLVGREEREELAVQVAAGKKKFERNSFPLGNSQFPSGHIFCPFINYLYHKTPMEANF